MKCGEQYSINLDNFVVHIQAFAPDSVKTLIAILVLFYSLKLCKYLPSIYILLCLVAKTLS